MKRERRKALLRVAIYAGAVVVAVGALVGRAVRAQTREASLEVGRGLADLAPFLRDGHSIRVNGETMFATASSSEQGVEVVLGRFKAHCENNPGAVSAFFPGATPGGGPSGFGTVYKISENDGVVFCLAKAPATRDELLGSFTRFLHTKNMGDLGMMRYAYVRRPADGVGSQILAAWTNEQFNMEALTPRRTDDAPGEDARLVPRPPLSLRRWSLVLDKSDYAAFVYASPKSAEETLSFYETELGKAGWHFDHQASDKGSEKSSLFLRGSQSVLVTLRDVNGEHAVTLLESEIRR